MWKKIVAEWDDSWCMNYAITSSVMLSSWGDPLFDKAKKGLPPHAPPTQKGLLPSSVRIPCRKPATKMLRAALARFPKPGAFFLRTVRRLRSGHYGVGLGPDQRPRTPQLGPRHPHGLEARGCPGSTAFLAIHTLSGGPDNRPRLSGCRRHKRLTSDVYIKIKRKMKIAASQFLLNCSSQ